MSKSRQNKKIWKKAGIVYDICSIPRDVGMDVEKIYFFAREYGILFYDSNSGDAPQILPKRYSVKFKKG